MFEVEKPRRFHYEPRFYDPEKEKWEALKKKYEIEQEKKQSYSQPVQPSSDEEGGGDLAYFEQRVRDIDAQRRQEASKMTWRDLFRKREMPKFNYQPRFSGQPTPSESDRNDADNSLADKYQMPKRQIKIKRRFDISDTDYMKPISGTKIILYCFVVFLLITLIIKFEYSALYPFLNIIYINQK